MDELEVLQQAYDRIVALTEGVDRAGLSRPTPCAEWDVRALLAHVVSGTDGLAALIRGEQPDFGKDDLGEDPAGRVRRSCDEALATWATPGAFDQSSQQLPGMRVVEFAMADAVVHAWDLATALGQPLGLDDAAVQPVYERWSTGVAEQGRSYGVFGPQVEVPGDTPVADRLVGLLGRDPAAAPIKSGDGLPSRG